MPKIKFDILSYLKSLNYEIELKSSNKYAYIRCPVCDGPGNNPHLWINIADSNRVHGSWGCWKSNRHQGSSTSLVMHLENLDYRAAKERIFNFSSVVPYNREEKEKEDLKFKEIKFPLNGLEEIKEGSLAMKYLKSRGFGYKEVIDWSLYYSKNLKYNKLIFKKRIIVPVYYQGVMVAFQGRDITGRDRVKYLSSPPEEGYAALNRTVYNIDEVNPNLAVVTEGVLDAWAVGKDCGTALFGKKIYQEQLELFYQKKIKRVVVALDGLAFNEALDVAHSLSFVVPRVTVLDLPEEEDPASLGKKRFWELFNEKKKG